MLDETRAKNLLQLREAEELILQLLSGTPQSVAQIVRFTELPRMTAFETLLSLKNRGIAKQVLVGKRHLWIKIETSQASKLLQNTLDIIVSGGKEEGSKVFIQIHEGGLEIYNTLFNLFQNNPGQRLLGIQSTESGQDFINVLGLEKTVEINNLIKDKKIITEIILQRNFTELKEELGEEWLESYRGRAAVVTFVPEDQLDIKEDIFIFKKSLLLINWKEKRMLKIIHPEVVSTFKIIFNALTLLGKKVDINSLLNK